MEINDLTEKVIGCAIKVHRNLGTGFLESVYQAALSYELSKLGISHEREKSLPVQYEEIALEVGFRCDFYIENCLIVECKAVKELSRMDEAQLLNYLKITNTQVGLLFNFNTLKLTDGLKRIVNNYDK
ncbi:MAG: GxxExxY protein [Methanosarcinaceae archaeon]|nr:GxxExxY protein [Methanosarcinaceae archaeon]